MTLALVRHGRTEWNRRRLMQGRSDVPLDDHGRAQAHAIAHLLATVALAPGDDSPADSRARPGGTRARPADSRARPAGAQPHEPAPWSRIVASPLARARETAEIIADHLDPESTGLRIGVDDRLIERDYGLAEGMPAEEARARWPHHDFPGAEPQSATIARALTVIGQLRGEGHPAVVVAHGTLIRLAVTELTGSPCPRVLNGEALLLDGTDGGFAVRRLRAEAPPAPVR